MELELQVVEGHLMGVLGPVMLTAESPLQHLLRASAWWAHRGFTVAPAAVPEDPEQSMFGLSVSLSDRRL